MHHCWLAPREHQSRKLQDDSRIQASMFQFLLSQHIKSAMSRISIPKCISSGGGFGCGHQISDDLQHFSFSGFCCQPVFVGFISPPPWMGVIWPIGEGWGFPALVFFPVVDKSIGKTLIVFGPFPTIKRARDIFLAQISQNHGGLHTKYFVPKVKDPPGMFFSKVVTEFPIFFMGLRFQFRPPFCLFTLFAQPTNWARPFHGHLAGWGCNNYLIHLTSHHIA